MKQKYLLSIVVLASLALLLPSALAATPLTVVYGKAFDMSKTPGTNSVYVPVPGTSPVDVMVMCKHNGVTRTQYTKLMDSGEYYNTWDVKKCTVGDYVRVISFRAINSTHYYSSDDRGFVKNDTCPVYLAWVDLHMNLKQVRSK